MCIYSCRYNPSTTPPAATARVIMQQFNIISLHIRIMNLWQNCTRVVRNTPVVKYVHAQIELTRVRQSCIYSQTALGAKKKAGENKYCDARRARGTQWKICEA